MLEGFYQIFHYTHHDRARTTIVSNAIIWRGKVIDCMQIRLNGDSSKPIINAANLILNSNCSQLETDDNED